MEQAGCSGLPWAVTAALLRNFKQKLLTESDHRGQPGGGKELVPARGGVDGEPVPALLLGQGADQGPGSQQGRLGSRLLPAALYETAPCFTTPGTQAALGLRPPFKFLTLFDFLLSLFKAKIDFMHYNPRVHAAEEHLPTPCPAGLDLFKIFLLIWVFQRVMQVFQIQTPIQDQQSSV